MKPIELNKYMVSILPNLESNYYDEIVWQEGDNTGSDVVFGDVFVPYTLQMIENNNLSELRKIFSFINDLLSLEDPYVSDVLKASVLKVFRKP